MPYKDHQFDLIVALEVLEHIPDYRKALKEIKRVSAYSCIFSIPQEPIWRLTNLLRLRYLKRLGDTPGHINHWNKKQFMNLLLNEGFKIKQVFLPFPWIMVLCTV